MDMHKILAAILTPQATVISLYQPFRTGVKVLHNPRDWSMMECWARIREYLRLDMSITHSPTTVRLKSEI